jgi:hypothetical protein
MRRWLWRRDTEFGTGFGGFDFGFLIVVGRARDAGVLVGSADIGFARTNADACRRLRIYLLAVPRVKVDPNDFSVLNDVKDRLSFPSARLVIQQSSENGNEIGANFVPIERSAASTVIPSCTGPAPVKETT